jgi:hypothetical protein
MKRGLFRLWILVSTCWVLAVGTIGVTAIVEEMCIIGPAGAKNCPIFERYVEYSNVDPDGSQR